MLLNIEMNMITIECLQINQILSLNNPEEVDMPLNKPNKIETNIVMIIIKTFRSESNFSIK